MTKPLRHTQVMALETIANEDECNQPLCLDEVLRRLPYLTSKQSFQFTVRSLIKRGLIERLERKNIDKKSRRLLGITSLGLSRLNYERECGYQAIDCKSIAVDEEECTDKMLREIEENFDTF